MNEAKLKGELCRKLREALPAAVVYRHEDMYAVGMPDISVTFGGRVCWVEVKFSKLGRASKPTELQAHSLARLNGLLVTYYLSKDRQKWVLVEEYNLERHGTGSDLKARTDPSPKSYGHDTVIKLIKEKLHA